MVEAPDLKSSGPSKSWRWIRGHRARGQGDKKIRGQGQGQPFRGQTLSRPRTGMLEAKAKDQGHKRKCSPKKKVFKNFFSGDLKKKNGVEKNFSAALENFNHSKNCAVFKPRTVQFSRTWGFAAKDLTFEAKTRPRPRTSNCVVEDVIEVEDVLENSTSAKSSPECSGEGFWEKKILGKICHENL